jgi:hypothetical protein
MKRRERLFFVAIAVVAFFISTKGSFGDSAKSLPPFNPARGLVLRGTVVTMDDQHTVIENGSILVRNDRIVALWRGPNPPFGTSVGDAEIVDFGPTALIFTSTSGTCRHFPVFATRFGNMSLAATCWRLTRLKPRGVKLA